MRFPKLTEAELRRMLQPPTGKVRVVIDTDAKNEIDDQFALAWALMSQDKLQIEGVYAEPYSWQYRLEGLRQAIAIRESGRALTEDEQLMVEHYESHIGRMEAMGIDPRTAQMDGPEVGMEQSYEEILVVYEKMGLYANGIAYRGSERYLSSLEDPVRSPAAEHLVELALASSPDDPLYIVAIGCVTNVASAMLLAPEIIRNIVVTWTAGFPTSARQRNFSFNLEQDMLSSQLLFDSGVPLVYLPGYHVGAQLRVSLPDIERWVAGQGAIGDYLHWLYTHNPLHEMQGIHDHFGRTWIVWDLINIAWLINPSWVPSDLVPAAVLGDDKRWHNDVEGRHLIREAYGIDRDAVFRDFFTKLEQRTQADERQIG